MEDHDLRPGNVVGGVDEGVDEGELGIAGGEHGVGHAPVGHGAPEDGGGGIGGGTTETPGVRVDGYRHGVDHPVERRRLRGPSVTIFHGRRL
jgi:hypothetical protein